MRRLALLASMFLTTAASAHAQNEICRPWDPDAFVVNLSVSYVPAVYAQRIVLSDDASSETMTVTGLRLAAFGVMVSNPLIEDRLRVEYRTPMGDLRPDLDAPAIAEFDQGGGTLSVLFEDEFGGGENPLACRVYTITHDPVELPADECLYVVFDNPLSDGSGFWQPLLADDTIPCYGCGARDGLFLINECPNLGSRAYTLGANYGLCLTVQSAGAPTFEPCRYCSNPDIPISDIARPGSCPGFVCNGGGASLHDFICFLSWWSGGNPNADITTDGLCFQWNQGDCRITLSDLSCYLAFWATRPIASTPITRPAASPSPSSQYPRP